MAWVSARDRGSLLGGLAAVADAAGLSGGGTGPGSADRGQLVRRWLETDGERCLLVFDDVADPEAVRPYLPAGGAARVIVTSHRGPDLGTGVQVEAFSAEEALAFLASRAGRADAAAGAVAAELGHLPLALAPAAAVIAGRQLEPGTYLDQLRARPAGPHPAGDEEYPPVAAQAVRLSLDAARAADPAGVSAGADGLISVLSGGGVRRDLLHSAGQLGALGGRRVAAGQVDDALEQAARWSLLTFSLDGQVIAGQPPGDPGDQGRPGQGTAAGGGLPGRRLGPRSPGRRRSPDHRIARPSGTFPSRSRRWPRRPGRSRRRRGPHPDPAAPAFPRALPPHRARRQRGAGHHDGEPLTADLERMLGPDHHDTLNSRNSLAAAYQAADRPADAIALFEQILVVRERFLGPEHPDTLTTQNNLASGTRPRAARRRPGCCSS